ncbi:MAG TPA: HDOD domain-containing protein [Bryobacteraceae bacterium]|jgi:c-di-GMP-related signal transduction protein|nr:HDOD domain-containing protein [Bryobacteraceae bacterium]
MDVLVARQAIFDRDRRVYGYELLFRSHAGRNEFDGTEGGQATKHVLANSLLVIGLENLVGTKKAFVNFGRGPLLQGWHASLPRGSTVIEVLETVEPDAEVVEACRQLREQGYQIALDDFVFRPGCEHLLEVADLIKIEIQSVPRPEQKQLVRSSKARGLQVLAEKVETHEEFEWARQAGYDYFQGYFFARPVIVRGRQIPAAKLHCLRLLQEAQRPELDFERLEVLILEDVSLSYQLLRYVNSPLFALTSNIRSIRQALLYFGETELRKWIALATLSRTAEDKPSELIRHSLVRARFCESVARIAQKGLEQSAFLTGLFSLLDALIDRPLEETLAAMCLAPEITAVLSGQSKPNDPLAGVYHLARAYEVADWQRVEEIAAQLKVPVASLGEEYCSAAGWASQVLEPGSVAQPV